MVATFTSSWVGYNVKTVVPLGPETTAVLCCPPGYSKGSWGHLCTSTVTVDQVLVYVAPRLDGIAYDRGPVRTTTVDKAATVQGDGVPIWWQNSDSAVLAAAATKMPTKTSENSQALSTPTLSPSESLANLPKHNTKSGLSTGAKVGLGVGIPIAVLLALAIAFILLRRRKARKPAAVMHSSSGNGQYVAKVKQAPVTHELRSEPVHEMEGETTRKPELPAT
jgi:hypothetical protein